MSYLYNNQRSKNVKPSADQYWPLSEILNLQTPHPNKLNVIGVVQQCLTPTTTKGADFQLTFSLIDDKCPNRPLDVKVFWAKLEELPTLSQGDIVLIRRIKHTFYKGKGWLISDKATTILYSFSSDLLTQYSSRDQFIHPQANVAYQSTPPSPLPLKPIDLGSVFKLHTWAHQNAVSTSFTSSARTGKLSTLMGVVVSQYHDLVVEICKLEYINGFLAAYVTDYTINEEFHDFQSPENAYDTEGDWQDRNLQQKTYSSRDWVGPLGKRTIRLQIYDPHLQWIQEHAGVGDILAFKNVLIHRYNEYIEGRINTDRGYPDKLLVFALNNSDDTKPNTAPFYKNKLELEVRKKKYYDGRKNRAARHQDTNTGRNNQKENSNSNNHGNYDRNATNRNSTRNSERNGESKNGNQVSPTVESVAPEVPISQYIKCRHNKMPIMTLTSILRHPGRLFFDIHGIPRMAPFLDIKYRARVRVVDFDPPNIRDFCRHIDDEAYNPPEDVTQYDGWGPSQTSVENDYSNASNSGKEWEWAFRLLVEDASLPTSDSTDNHNNQRHHDHESDTSNPDPYLKPGKPRMELIVSGADAEGLLNLTATDLHDNSKTLGNLKSQLFILWGNLAEIKEKPEAGVLSNTAFDCQIMEYGVRQSPIQPGKTSKWVRCQKIFATFIKNDNIVLSDTN